MVKKFIIGAVLSLLPSIASAQAVAINNNATYTTSRNVTVSIDTTLRDPTYPNTTAFTMRVAVDGVWGAWETIASTKNVTFISSGDGAKTVSVMYGFIHPMTISDTITLDTTPPVDGTYTLKNNNYGALELSGILSTAEGPTTGRNYNVNRHFVTYRLDRYPANCTDGTSSTGSFAFPAPVTVPKDVLLYTRICAQDTAGNWSRGVLKTAVASDWKNLAVLTGQPNVYWPTLGFNSATGEQNIVSVSQVNATNYMNYLSKTSLNVYPPSTYAITYPPMQDESPIITSMGSFNLDPTKNMVPFGTQLRDSLSVATASGADNASSVVEIFKLVTPLSPTIAPYASGKCFAGYSFNGTNCAPLQGYASLTERCIGSGCSASGTTWSTFGTAKDIAAVTFMGNYQGTTVPRYSVSFNADRALHYAGKDENGMVYNEVVDSSVDTGYKSSITISGDGKPVIIYSDALWGNIKAAKKTSAGWIITNLQANSDTAVTGTAITRDPVRNILYAFYRENMTAAVKYVTSPDNGATWSTPKYLDADGLVGRNMSAAYNPVADAIYVIYQDETNLAIKESFLPLNPAIHTGY